MLTELATDTELFLFSDPKITELIEKLILRDLMIKDAQVSVASQIFQRLLL